MFFENWAKNVTFKVQDFWNLHETLSKKTNFFVFVFSVCEIFENDEQNNYAAGNTFQNVLVQYRVSFEKKKKSLLLI